MATFSKYAVIGIVLVTLVGNAAAQPGATEPSAANASITVSASLPASASVGLAPAKAPEQPPEKTNDQARAKATGVYGGMFFGGGEFGDEFRARATDGFATIGLVLGARLGPAWSIEGRLAVAFYDRVCECENFWPSYGSGGIWSLSAKYQRPLGKASATYLRATASRAQFDGEYGGNGLGAGGGIQISGDVPVIGFAAWPLFFTGLGPKIRASLFAEVGYDFYRLHPTESRGGRTYDATMASLQAGFTLGKAF